MEKKDTIFALSTPYGRSAVAMIRLSGPNSLNIAKTITIKKSRETKENQGQPWKTVRVPGEIGDPLRRPWIS